MDQAQLNRVGDEYMGKYEYMFFYEYKYEYLFYQCTQVDFKVLKYEYIFNHIY